MKGYLVTIGVILLAGGIIFSPQILGIISNMSPTVHDVQRDLNDLQNNVLGKVGSTIDGTINKVSDKIGNLKKDSSDFLFTQNFNEQKTISQTEKTLSGKKIQNNNNDKNDDNDEDNLTERLSTSKATTTTTKATSQPSNDHTPTQDSIFETLSLTTSKQEDDMLVLRYEDTSKKTVSVTVTLRNDEKELFSGDFYSSKFETLVDDASGIPHYIDLVVEHAEYGTITSSVFNPAGSEDTIINGIFTPKS